MVGPPCRVVAGSKAAHGCPCEHAFDCTTEPRRHLWPLVPDWLENFDERDVDDVNGQLAKGGACEPRHGRAPLIGMLGRPFRAVRAAVRGYALVERHSLGGRGRKRCPLGVAFGNWVTALIDELA